MKGKDELEEVAIRVRPPVVLDHPTTYPPVPPAPYNVDVAITPRVEGVPIPVHTARERRVQQYAIHR